jgi:addiction module HigA family antidote
MNRIKRGKSRECGVMRVCQRVLPVQTATVTLCFPQGPTQSKRPSATTWQESTALLEALLETGRLRDHAARSALTKWKAMKASGNLASQAPGTCLARDFMPLAELDVKGFANLLKIPSRELEGILQNRQQISTELAVELGSFFGVEAIFWLQWQDSWLHREENRGHSQMMSVC